MPSDDLLLSLLWIVPMGGAFAVCLIPDRAKAAIRGFALGTTVVTLLLALVAWRSFVAIDPSRAPLAIRSASANPGDLVVRHAWIPDFGMQYYLGLDGISLALVLLAGLVGVLACLASWKVEEKVRGYFALFLLLNSTLMGAFLSLDLVLFYVFFEAMLLPMYFLIALWGGDRREYAAMKFLLYTLFGSVFILVAILALYFWPGDAPSTLSGRPFEGHTFDSVLLARAASETGYYGPWVQRLAFLLFLAGFSVKLPSFPFHTWLPDAHVQAPTPISMILAGVLLKVGGYGLIRFAWPLAPSGAHDWAWPVAALGGFTIVYGALLALAQADLKRLVAYSSISHMGYVTLGLASMNLAGDPRAYAFGLDGAMYMMIAHGITSTGMFFLVGAIESRAGIRDLGALGGLARAMPLACLASTVIFFGSMGLPGLCGFVAEVFVILAAFGFSPSLGALAAFAVVLAAAYVLRAIRRTFLGANPRFEGVADLDRREVAILAPLVLLTVGLGVYPRVVLDWMGPSVVAVARSITEARGNRPPATASRGEAAPDPAAIRPRAE